MTRQQEITFGQVCEKRNLAARTIKDELAKALAASTNEHLYEKHLANARKATEDFGTWSKCLESLRPA